MLLSGLISQFGFSQNDTTLLYLRFPIVPSFKLINVADSTYFTKDDLPKKRSTVIMVFSPECEHCQEETKQIKANIKLFKKANIIMASPLPYEQITAFYNEYNIAQYPNIRMGRDPSYYFGTFYKIRSFPAIYVYDKKGNFKQAFSGSVSINEIAAAL